MSWWQICLVLTFAALCVRYVLGGVTSSVVQVVRVKAEAARSAGGGDLLGAVRRFVEGDDEPEAKPKGEKDREAGRG